MENFDGKTSKRGSTFNRKLAPKATTFAGAWNNFLRRASDVRGKCIAVLRYGVHIKCRSQAWSSSVLLVDDWWATTHGPDLRQRLVPPT